MRATLDHPAQVRAAAGAAALAGAQRRVIVTIVAFTPPPDGKPVEIVVSAVPASGPARELGRVAVTPYAAFGASETARHRTFAFHLPTDLANTPALDLRVALVPVRGGGAGAGLEVGSATLR